MDPELASARRQRNVLMEEELTLDLLLQDLNCQALVRKTCTHLVP